MISHEDIKNLVSEWQLREDIIEKDYVIGWVLWGIGADPDISHKWIFKGGTCLKKCYIETSRIQTHPKLIRTVLIEKCKTKGVPLPTYNSIKDSPYIDELEGEWQNMLGHQLQILPPFEQFRKELPLLFDWLEETYVPETLSTVAIAKEEDSSWIPPPTIWNWGIGIPLESIRFAGANPPFNVDDVNLKRVENDKCFNTYVRKNFKKFKRNQLLTNIK